MQGLLGRKIGMTRVFGDQGRQVPVTVIECGPCLVLQAPRQGPRGTASVQLGFGPAKEKHLTRADLGLFKKANLAPQRHRCEVTLDPNEAVKPGDLVTVALFDGVSHVDVTGVTKGRGFQGVVRRHRMSGGPITHGGHSKRRIGSIGCRELPGRIHKGKRMPGHMGHVRATQQNLKVIQVLKDQNALLVHGAIPGPAGAVVLVRRALKKSATPS